MKKPRVAHLSERYGDQGRLCGHVADWSGHALEWLEPTEPEVAIAWARARVNDVRINLLDQQHKWSAGTENPLDLPDWPGWAAARAEQ